MTTKRRLAAIMSADVAGYSRLMRDDELATVSALDASRDVFRRNVAAHGGRVVDTAGDSVLAVFDSAVEAVSSGLEIQNELNEHNRTRPIARRMLFRIGVNLGDIIGKEDGTVYGDGVNIAARLESLATPGEICISGNVHEVSASSLSLETEDLGEQTVKNIAQPVRTYRVRTAASNGSASPFRPETPPAIGSAKPTIAVLPFENLSGDAEQEYFADGIAEDIITELSRLRSLVVIARNSSFAYKERGSPGDKLAEELGARYVVHGSVRKVGSRARITAKLVDAETDGQLWGDRYDRELDDVFSVQDEITRKIVSILPSRIEAADLKRSQSKPTDSLAAYEFLLRGKFHHHKRTSADNEIAREMLDRAVGADPNYTQAHAWRACAIGQALARGYIQGETHYADVMQSLQTALALDDDDFECHRILSGVYVFQRDFDRAAFHAARAVELNPNDPRVISQYGEVLTLTGDPQAGIDALQRAVQVDPYRPDGRLTDLGFAQFVAGHYEDAAITFQRISALQAKHHSYLAACYTLLEDTDRAELHAAEVRRLEPDFSAEALVEQVHYKNDADRDHHIGALHKAGL